MSRALRDARAERALRETQEQVRDRYGFKNLLSRSPPMLEVFDQIEAVAPTDATVLVLGVLLGGTVGVGTLAFTLGIGPLVQVFLPRLALPPRRTTVPVAG